MTGEDWRRGQPQPELAAGEIHVWRVRLDTPVTGETPLSADELQRAQRLCDAWKRNHFIAGRAAMRDLLGGYTGIEPDRLQFVYGPHGKPSLRDNPLRFNFSNSGEIALLAVACDREVGIDIEYRDRSISVEPLAAHILTAAEAAAFRRLPQGKRRAALLAAWTRKEAYLKALGTGFSLSLNSFSVAVPADGEPAVLELGDSPDTKGRWKFVPLFPHPEYLATLTAPDTDWNVRRFDGN
jgi:4'-phosphopantetheinyl transferase